MRHKLLVGAILFLTLLVFLPEIHYSLVYDDSVVVVENPRLTDWRYVPGYFTTHYAAHVPLMPPRYYRPVSLIWLRLVYATLGAPRGIWHLASILAHLVATACVFLLIRCLGGNFKGAALAAALFAVHPIQTEAVAWVSSYSDLLLTSFLVLSVYYYAERKGPISLPSVVFAVLAMFTKEAGIVAPALILAYEWIHSRFRNAIVNVIPYSVCALIYIVFRVNALGSPMTAVDSEMSLSAMILTWPRVLAIYARHLVLPVHLSVWYDVPVETALWPLLALLVVIVGLVWLVRGSCANVQFGAAWFAITLAPALAIRYTNWHDFVHDRYLYLPSVGLALIAAVWFGRIRLTFPRAIVVCVLTSVLCWGTRMNLRIWQDNIALFSRAVEVAPENPIPRNSLAVAYLNAGRAPEAFPLLEQLTRLYPAYADADYNMGRYYQQIGNAEAADHFFSIANEMYGLLRARDTEQVQRH